MTGRINIVNTSILPTAIYIFTTVSLKISKLFTKQTKKFYNLYKTVVVVQLPGHVWLFVTSQPATYQTSLFLTCPRICPSSCPLNWWCHPIISSSFTLFFFCLQSFQASGSFPMSQLFTLGGQSIAALTSVSVLPINIQGWFPLGLIDLISLLSKGLSNTTGRKWCLMLLFPRHF